MSMETITPEQAYQFAKQKYPDWQNMTIRGQSICVGGSSMVAIIGNIVWPAGVREWPIKSVCDECGRVGSVDSGGIREDGSFIDVPCGCISTKVPIIIKEFCVRADSPQEALDEKTIPSIGALYKVSSIELTRSPAFPEMYYVLAELTGAAAVQTESTGDKCD